jgi:hypothetical protein
MFRSKLEYLTASRQNRECGCCSINQASVAVHDAREPKSSHKRGVGLECSPPALQRELVACCLHPDAPFPKGVEARLGYRGKPELVSNHIFEADKIV